MTGWMGSSPPRSPRPPASRRPCGGRQLAGKVMVITVDASDALLEDLRGGTVNGIVAQDPFGMGSQAVQTLVDKLNGGSPKKRYDLAPRVVVAADLDKPDVQQLLKPDIQKYSVEVA